MLTYFPPDASRIADLTAYRKEVMNAPGNPERFDGSAGLGNFGSVEEWLERVSLLTSEKAEKYGWYRTLIFLAYDGPTLCGIVNLRLSEDETVDRLAGHIGYHVRPSLRRRGYAKEMLRHAAMLAREHGIPEPTVCTAADNLPSQKTALSAGFSPDGEDVLPNGEKILRFRLINTAIL